MLATEVSAQPGAYSWTVEYGYNANGHLSTLKYPSLSTVSYAPNALGQPTQAGAFATGVKYYPNGAIREFHYGNGIRHQMLQNARQLPARSTDTGVLDMEYGFDENGNVLATADHLNSSRSRWMQYDDLDRLTAAGSASFGGDHWHRFTYDVLDNLRSWKLGAATAGGAPAKDFATYEYDTKNRLTRILGTGGQVRESFTWDVQGNLKTKTGTTWNFDYGNRNRGIANQEGFRYDGHGRRVSTWLPQQGRSRFYMYAQSGQLLFEGSETQQKNMEHVHLGGSLIASIEYLHGGGGTQVRYKHTDALGTPVVMTDAAGNEIAGTRKVYEPFGQPLGGDVDGIGYTGHVMDPQSDLVYMQQRYYDPEVGRFLSIDPVSASSVTGSNFNRYNYAANNPYRFVDPDGRFAMPWCTGSLCNKYRDTDDGQGNYGCSLTCIDKDSDSDDDEGDGSDSAARRVFNASIDARLTKDLKIAIRQNEGLTMAMVAGSDKLSVSINTNGVGVATVGGTKFGFNAGSDSFADLAKYDQRIARMGLLSINASVSESGMLGFTATFSPPGRIGQLLGGFGGGVTFGFEVQPVNAVLYNSGLLGNAARALNPDARQQRIENCITNGVCN